ncbi:MAG: sigma-54-dependent Fis family transcriptional regulator [Alloprevotella sp.]|nr:sigma-54-dependent Fis family transcriptional regulator [Alloprevotella sp.]
MNDSQIQSTKRRYDIIGNAEGLNRAVEVALKIAPVDISVLVEGENGVGKEVIPRIIHDNSLRKQKRYLALNCGAIPEGTIDSELFGHEKGAFTSAVDKREGYFSVANGGTLFLDEVGELPLSTQARLLRVLETGEYIPVGSSEVRKTNVRIVAATNVDMERAVEEGKFRQDLYYRLCAVRLSVPPLRERGDDIVLLFRKFALDVSEKYRMAPIRLTADAQHALKAYAWPGNVRQLKNLVESLSVTSEEREITADTLRSYLPAAHRRDLVALPHESSGHDLEQIYQLILELRRDVSELQQVVGLRGGRPAGPRALVPYVRDDDSPSMPDTDLAPFAEAEEIPEDTATHQPLSLEDTERELIRATLHRNGGRRKDTARQLGISDRTLYRKIKEYGLED